LAAITKGTITALDNHPPFIEKLNQEATQRGCADRVKGITGDMGKTGLKKHSFDVIWSEGAANIINNEATRTTEQTPYLLNPPQHRKHLPYKIKFSTLDTPSKTTS